jgi:hypothetical protein
MMILIMVCYTWWAIEREREYRRMLPPRRLAPFSTEGVQ